MEAGKLNRRVSIQSRTVTYNAFNEEVETWAHSFYVWAQVVTTGGGEFYAAQRLNSEVSAVFNVRYDKDITIYHRINYGGRIFDILSVNDVDGMRKVLQIAAKEVL
jgi:SPP1 family predicted phage head-tail adaptor